MKILMVCLEHLSAFLAFLALSACAMLPQMRTQLDQQQLFDVSPGGGLRAQLTMRPGISGKPYCPVFRDRPFSAAHPQDKFSLQMGERGGDFSAILYKAADWRSPVPFSKIANF